MDVAAIESKLAEETDSADNYLFQQCFGFIYFEFHHIRRSFFVITLKSFPSILLSPM